MTSIKSIITKSAAFAAVVLLCAAPLASQAGTKTGNLSVSATISNNCVFGTSTLAFGAYDPIGTNASTSLTATGSIGITCTNGDSLTFTADNGQNHSSASGTCNGSACTRAMKSGSNFLSYDIYTTSGGSTVWNNSNSIAATATGSAQTVSCFGFIPAGSSQPAGTYNDTVVVTVTF